MRTYRSISLALSLSLSVCLTSFLPSFLPYLLTTCSGATEWLRPAESTTTKKTQSSPGGLDDTVVRTGQTWDADATGNAPAAADGMSANVVADTITTAESSHPPALSLTQQRESPPRAATTTASSSTGTSRSRAPSNIVRAFVTISRRDTGTHGEHCDSVQLVVVDETTLEVVGRSPAPDFHATTAYSTLSCVSTDEMALERGKSYHIVADFQSTCDEGSCKDFYWISVVRPYALCGDG